MTSELALLIIEERKGKFFSAILQLPDFSSIVYRDKDLKKMAPDLEASATVAYRLAILNHHLRSGYEYKGCLPIHNYKSRDKSFEYYLLPPATKKKTAKNQKKD